MRGPGGTLGRGWIARGGLSVLLACGLVAGGSGAALATGAAPPDQQAPPAAPVEPAPPVEPVEPAPPVDGAEQPVAPGDGLIYVSGFVANGHAGGPTVFDPWPGDETYPVPEPPVNEHLPLEVDELGPYVRQISCDPQDRPGITAFALLIFEHYGRPAYHGSRPCVPYNSFHHDGRALDWALNAYDPMDRRLGDAVALWLTENDGEMAARFGIENLIWNWQVWDRWNGWQIYVGHPHDDHIHFSFTWDGAQMNTSWWTGVAVTQPDLGPCEVAGAYSVLHVFPRRTPCSTTDFAPPLTGLPQVQPSADTGLSSLQEMLGVPVTGLLDNDTRNALVQWQLEHDVPATGVPDELTVAGLHGWSLPDLALGLQAMLPKEWQRTEFTPHLRSTVTQGETGPAVVLLQETLGVEPDGDFGPLTAQTLTEWEESVPVLAIQAQRRGEGPAVVTPLTWTLLERAAHPTIDVRELELREGDADQVADPDGAREALGPRYAEDGSPVPTYAGGAVTFLQTLLGIEADGDFGPLTAEAVREVQLAADLEPTGVVDGPTWRAIEVAAIEAGHVPGPPGLAAQREQEAVEQAEREAAEQAEREAARAEQARAGGRGAGGRGGGRAGRAVPCLDRRCQPLTAPCAGCSVGGSAPKTTREGPRCVQKRESDRHDGRSP
jgi:peptidoglycan hydrolase-like protein with peptidoglycan-binding domain